MREQSNIWLLLLVLAAAAGAQDKPAGSSAAETLNTKPSAAQSTTPPAGTSTIATGAQQKNEVAAQPKAVTTHGYQTRLPEKVQAESTVQVSAGDYVGALATYKSAQVEAAQTGDKVVEAEAALSYGRTVEQWVALDPQQSSRLPEAVEAYKHVATTGPSNQKAIALNNLGVLMIRQGKPANAISYFQQVDFSIVPAEQRFAIHYNYARALETQGQINLAFSQYQAAFKERPGFKQAADGAARVLLLSETPRVGEMVTLGDRLLSVGFADAAVSNAVAALERWHADSRSEELLALLARSLAGARHKPATFISESWPKVEKLGSTASLRGPVAEVRAAYQDRFWPRATQQSESELLPSWSRTQTLRHAMSVLLKSVGETYARNNSDEALARYYLAWQLDRDNLDAVLYAADLVRAHRTEPYRAILDRLTDRLFSAKGLAYQGNDWANVFRLHMVLASIFESLERWGPRYDVRSVVFQLEHAARAERVLRERDRNFPPAPGLHLRLAEAYRNMAGGNDVGATQSMLRQAWEEYLIAAEEFVRDSKRKEASAAVEQASKLPVVLTSQMQTRLANVRRSVEAIGPG